VTAQPKRVQLSRAKGWRKPEGTIVVSRPSKWGNPYRAGNACRASMESMRAVLVALFAKDLRAAIDNPWGQSHTIEFRTIAESLHELRGHDLACWCSLDQPCHADVLLALANPVENPETLRDLAAHSEQRATITTTVGAPT